MFVARLGWAPDDFYKLTPVEADLILSAHYEYESEFYSFIANETRRLGFFIVKSSFGGAKSIRTPEQLYKLPNEVIAQAEKQKRFIENQGVVFEDADKNLLKKYFNWNFNDQSN